MTRVAMLLAFLLGAGALPVRAQDTEGAGEDPAKVEAEIDAQKTVKDEARVQELSTQFSVPAEKVQTMRGANQGWGAVTVQLAMAQELAKTDPTTYPTTQDALAKVEALRGENKGWGEIANELGLKLGPVVSAARHARHDVRKSERQERRSQRMGRSERGPKAPKADRPPRGPKY